ncbi:MAG: hypothetical protein ACRDRN_13170 [Sciscionella sp.]
MMGIMGPDNDRDHEQSTDDLMAGTSGRQPESTGPHDADDVMSGEGNPADTGTDRDRTER